MTEEKGGLPVFLNTSMSIPPFRSRAHGGLYRCLGLIHPELERLNARRRTVRRFGTGTARVCACVQKSGCSRYLTVARLN
jgi:hypothetical protein